MGPTGAPTRSGRRALALAVLVAAGALTVSVTAASGKVPKLPTTPTCARFSTRKVSTLLGVGRMYLVHALVNGTSCSYYGVNAAQANALATRDVPYNQIKYVPSLMIAVQTTTKTLFDFQLGLLRKGSFVVDAVHPKLRLGSEEYFSSGKVTSTNLMPCESEILYNNWLGPPSCIGQPLLQEVAVLAWIPLSHGPGRMVYLSAAAQTPPGGLTISHMLELTSESVTGALY